jgi:hypothetical protein
MIFPGVTAISPHYIYARADILYIFQVFGKAKFREATSFRRRIAF